MHTYITLHDITLHYILLQTITYINTYMETNKHTYIHTYRQTYIHHTLTYIDIRRHTSTYTDIHRPDFSKRDIWSCIYSMWKKNNCLISEHAATGETFLSQSPADVLPKELPSSAWTCSCLWCGERGTVLMKTSMTQVFVCHSHCPLTLFWYWNMAGNASVQTDTSSPRIWELS